MKYNLTHYFIGVLITVSLWSCNQNEVYYEFATLPQNQWNKDNEICFEIDSVFINSLRKYNMDIEITHNVTYAYNTLWLCIDQFQNDTVIKHDTIEFVLTNDIGQWKGRGNGPTRQFTVLHTTDLNLDTTKQNKVCFHHAMQNIQLTGIERIGLKIY